MAKKSTVAKAAKKPLSSAAKAKISDPTLLGKIKSARKDATGLTSRVKGHVSARGRRAQAGRSARKLG